MEVKMFDNDTKEEILFIPTYKTTVLSDISYSCFYCGQSYKLNEGHSCNETVGVRFDRLEKEIERLNALLKNINL